MCDILVALGDSTSSGRLIFGKNSDRPDGETQILHRPGPDETARRESIRCAFLEVPAPESPRLRTLGCRPYWCWGYETGLNEAGVVGGNTAVYTRTLRLPSTRKADFGLTGMELLRFGLELGERAETAVGAIIELLERYGQWAPAVQGLAAPEACYENAFLIADPEEAWILETTGRRWAAVRHRTGTHALSNQLTIRESRNRASSDLAEHAIEMGWWRDQDGDLDFAHAYSDHENYPRQVSHLRWSRSKSLLRAHEGSIDPSLMMSFLRDHYEDTFLEGPQFSPDLPDFLTLCMHDSPAGFTWGNTATSMVVEVDPERPQATPYWICYQPPCSSIYIGAVFGMELPRILTAPGNSGLHSTSPSDVAADEFDDRSLWWRLYRLLHAVREHPSERRAELRKHLDPIEVSGNKRLRALLRGRPSVPLDAVRESAEQQLDEIHNVLETLEARWGLDRAISPNRTE